MVRRPLKASSLPETSSFVPGGIWVSRVNLKNTSSAVPVSSLTMIRQGWRDVAGRSWRTTSTARVATVPGLAAADGRAGAAVEVGFRHVEQQVDDPVAAGRLGDQGGDGGSYAAQTGQGREKWGKCLGVHGLTVIQGTAI